MSDDVQWNIIGRNQPVVGKHEFLKVCGAAPLKEGTPKITIKNMHLDGNKVAMESIIEPVFPVTLFEIHVVVPASLYCPGSHDCLLHCHHLKMYILQRYILLQQFVECSAQNRLCCHPMIFAIVYYRRRLILLSIHQSPRDFRNIYIY